VAGDVEGHGRISKSWHKLEFLCALLVQHALRSSIPDTDSLFNAVSDFAASDVLIDQSQYHEHVC
jgi:hypothetical protein